MPRVCLLGSQHLLGAKRVPRGLWGQRLALRPGHIAQSGLHGTPPFPASYDRDNPNPRRQPAAPPLNDGCG